MSASVYDSIVLKHAELSAIVAKIAAENRAPSDDEKGRLSALQSEIDTIKSQWETAGRKAFLEGLSNGSKPSGPVVLKANQSFADAVKAPSEFEACSLGRILKGYVAGDWSGAELEQKAMASSPTSAGGILIPGPLASRVIDRARNKAVVFRAGASTVPMTSATLTMARLTTDPTAAWYSEASPITTSDAAFDSVVFTARKLATLVAINNELLDDANNLDSIVEQAIGDALALKLDYTALFGSGSAPEPQGLHGLSGIGTVTSVGTPADYGKFLDAIYAVRGANFEPNAAVYSVRTGKGLAKLATGISGDKTPLPMPADWSELVKLVSNQVPDTLNTNESVAFVGDFSQLAIGIRNSLQIEVSREGGYVSGGTNYHAFQKDQTLIRAVLRADVQVFHAGAFCELSGITA